jgi:hypothetical protein
MTDPLPQELARREIALLLPLRDKLVRRAGRLRATRANARAEQVERLDARALRCERVIRLLETRIRLAAEVLATGALAAVEWQPNQEREAS